MADKNMKAERRILSSKFGQKPPVGMVIPQRDADRNMKMARRIFSGKFGQKPPVGMVIPQRDGQTAKTGKWPTGI